jgi:DNA-binding transcriptional regulator YdaS (Cro superfamily)
MRFFARIHRRLAANSLRLGMTALMLCSALAGCTGSGETEVSLNAPTPVSLTPQRDPAAANALTGPVNEAELRKAVERYRLTKQRNASQIDFAGADLNGDGRSEALVLFSGPDWCLRTGCSLVIFQEHETGYRPVSHITRARPPVMIGPDSNFGWRDLIANTGGGPAPIRTVRLGFTGKGYPINALLQPEPVQELLARSQQIIAESTVFTAAMNQLAAQSAQE